MINRAFIGLGSNLEDPQQQIINAFDQLSKIPKTQLINRSSLYRSVAIGPGEQPDYINAVAELHTELEPEVLLDQLQQIENAQGRVRGEIRWTARTLDLDLLLFNDTIIETTRLSVPHPLLAERNFVLYPLHELAPTLTLPNGDTLAALLRRVAPTGLSRLD